MTCIVSYIDKINNKIWIGGDSAGVAGMNITIRSDEKVFTKFDERKDVEFIFGYTTSFRMAQILRYSMIIPEVGDKDIYEYMCTDFINSVRRSLRDGGFMQIDNNEEIGGTFIVGVSKGGRVFRIGSDFQVGEPYLFYDSVGCGSSYALGNLHSREKNKGAKESVTSALDAATFFSSGVEAPFCIKSIDTVS